MLLFKVALLVVWAGISGSLQAQGTPTVYLQTILDEYCQERCATSPIMLADKGCSSLKARYMVPSGSLPSGWQCVGNWGFPSGRSAQCIDNCGVLYPCNRISWTIISALSEANRELSVLAKINKFKHCKQQQCTSDIQPTLDAYCRTVTRFICGPNSKACPNPVVARKDVGAKSTEKTKQWRCYSDTVLSTNSNTSICADSCTAYEVPCTTSVSGDITGKYWNVGSALESLIARHKGHYFRVGLTGELQALLDKACRDILADVCNPHSPPCYGYPVARKDNSLPSLLGPDRWRCFGPISIRESRYSSLCITDCGKEIPCMHGVDPEAGAMWSYSTMLEEAIERDVLKTCNPQPPPQSDLQNKLNAFCKNTLADICKGKFCEGGAVARKDVGDMSDQTKQWRCYSPSQLSLKTDTAICVNNCGEETPCGDGVFDGVSYLHWNMRQKIEALIQQHKTSNCLILL